MQGGNRPALWRIGHLDLDLYAGTLTRYYLGDWDRVLLPGGVGGDDDLMVTRIRDNGHVSPDPVEIRQRVLAWRAWMNEEVDLLEEPLDWPEERDIPYVTDKPTLEGFAALQLWAAYAEQPKLKRPSVLPEDWAADPALAASNDDDYQSRYPQLLYAVDIWLPVPVGEVFDAIDIDEDDCRFGSVPALVAELEALNADTWRADDTTLELWRAAGLSPGADLETLARFGFASFLRVARRAEELGLPMLVEWPYVEIEDEDEDEE